MGQAPTARFSDRVEDYVRYRPGYPPEVLELLRVECGLRPAHAVADIASGTGAFTRLLLENGNRVFAVEPNAGMREAGSRLLHSFTQLASVAGTAEDTTLPSCSVDFVTAAQAAHWFDRRRARAEFVRILKPGGWCVLIWNERRTEATPFLRDYERLHFEGTAGRLLSSSYAPLAGRPNHRQMMAELERIFHAQAQQGVVEFEYNTRVFFGKLS